MSPRTAPAEDAPVPVQRRRLTRGSVERAGPTWWNRYREEIVDPSTGEVRRRQARMRLGSRQELRTRAAAAAQLDRLLALLQAAVPAPGERASFLDYSERFLALHVALLRPASRRAYTNAVRRHLAPAFAGLQLDQVDLGAAQGLIAKMAATHARATVRFTRDLLLQLLRQARRDGLAAHVLSGRDLKLPKAVDVREQPHFDVAQVELLVTDPGGTPAARTLWAVCAYAGLRGGEALALRWRAVHLEKRMLSVDRAASAGRIALPKTASSVAAVPLIPRLIEILSGYRDVWTPNGAGLLFATRKGTVLRLDDVRRRWLKPQLERLGLPQAGVHALRHSTPAILHGLGLSTPTVRAVLRHASLAQTQAYMHHDLEATLRELDGLARRAE